MRKTFLLNIGLLLFLNVLIKPFFIFGIEIPVQNLVGNTAYGEYFTFLSLGYILQLLNDFGLQNYTSSHLPEDKSRLSELMLHIGSLKGLLALVFIIAITVCGASLGYLQSNPELFLVIALNIILISLLQYLRANIAGLGRYLTDSILSASDKAIMLLVLIWILYISDKPGQEFSMLYFALIQTLSLIIPILLSLFILLPKLSFHLPGFARMRVLLMEALPYGLVIALMFLYTKLDAIMIEQIMEEGRREAGLYASAYRLLDASNMVVYLFAGLLLPMFASLKGKPLALTNLYYTGFSLVWFISLAIALPIYLWRHEIMDLLYTDTTDSAKTVLGILMLAFFIKSTTYVSGTLLTAFGKLRLMNLFMCFTVLLNILLNYLLIKSDGIGGAALATLITQALVALGFVVICHRKELVNLRLRQYLLALVILIVMIPISIAISETRLFSSWYYNFILCLCVYLPVFLVFNYKQFKNIVKEKWL
jgi:O-antigen/teichoic acid export membrane protein